MSDDGDRTYWLTAYDLVAASTVVPPSPVTLRSTGEAAEVWTWDESSGLGLIATGDVEATPRTWIPAETTITSGSLLTVSLPTDGPPLPVTVTVEEPLTGPEDSFTVRVDGTVLPLGAGLTAPDGRLVGILTAADYTGGNTVATVTVDPQRLLRGARLHRRRRLRHPSRGVRSTGRGGGRRPPMARSPGPGSPQSRPTVTSQRMR